MIVRDELRALLDAIPEERLSAAQEALTRLTDPVLLSLLHAPAEDEALSPDELADLAEAEAERAAGAGQYVSHDELAQQIGA